MRQVLETIAATLLGARADRPGHTIIDVRTQLDLAPSAPAAMARSLNAAFLMMVAGPTHPAYLQARALLDRAAALPEWATAAAFYLRGLAQIAEEIEQVATRHPELAERLTALASWLAEAPPPESRDELSERVWSVFYPEAVGMRQARPERVAALRDRRTVTIAELNPDPLDDPARQILFTSNVLITIPDQATSVEALPLSDDLKALIQQSAREPQRYWYDHPIQIGVEPPANEILYGLRGLDQALQAEVPRGNLGPDGRVTCILSISATHAGLQQVARPYLEQELANSQALRHLDVYAFTEADTRRIVDEVLAPAARQYTGHDHPSEALAIFGVDGEYGRHYSFLKAIAALWQLIVEPQVRGTFKIDLDQVFPQAELVEQAGASALEQFKTPLWGARGLDSAGQPVELGMIAGALVNERDIGRSLFTPDVVLPDRQLTPDEHVFFSAVPQAISTEAEMLARYDGAGLDGRTTCIQRIHVTGGTNGILIEALRRHRPFTPSFIGRAEDQAYLLSTFPRPGLRLAYLHKDGLIMRHDKEAFAQEAIKAAQIGKLVGDYVRTLYFSAYARALDGDVTAVKARIDPFTGGFVSLIPSTLVWLRFGLKAAALFAAGQEQSGFEFVTMGSRRLDEAMAFAGPDGMLAAQYERERQGWDLFYQILDTIEAGLAREDPFALELRGRARALLEGCLVRPVRS